MLFCFSSLSLQKHFLFFFLSYNPALYKQTLYKRRPIDFGLVPPMLSPHMSIGLFDSFVFIFLNLFKILFFFLFLELII